MLCPLYESLALYANKQLEEKDQQDISNHLLQPCQLCLDKLELFKAEVYALNHPLDTVPDRLKLKAESIFKQSIYVKPNLPGIILAVMVFDSIAPTSMAEVRSLPQPSLSKSRRFIFHADTENLNSSNLAFESVSRSSGFDIDVEIRCLNNSNSYDVRGQVIFEEEQSEIPNLLNVDLFYMGKEHSHSTTANEFGEFAFPDVNEAFYTLQIKSGAWTVVATLPVTI